MLTQQLVLKGLVIGFVEDDGAGPSKNREKRVDLLLLDLLFGLLRVAGVVVTVVSPSGCRLALFALWLPFRSGFFVRFFFLLGFFLFLGRLCTGAGSLPISR